MFSSLSHSSQVFWGYLIVRVLYKLIRDGHVEDNRSDNEEETEEESPNKSHKVTKKKSKKA
jgi:hypothetical protein